MSSPIMFADRVVTNQSDIMSRIKMFVVNQRPLSEPVCRLLAPGLMVATADRNSRAFCGQEASFCLFFFLFVMVLRPRTLLNHLHVVGVL